MNFLESLAAEWLDYTGYFVKTNIRAKKLKTGGYRHELDVLGYLPEEGLLVHIETSGDSDSLATNKKKFQNKKFVLSDKEYEAILGVPIKAVRRIAVFGQAKNPKIRLDLGKDIEVWFVHELVRIGADEVRDKDLMSEGVPEKYPILRTMQMMVHYGV